MMKCFWDNIGSTPGCPNVEICSEAGYCIADKQREGMKAEAFGPELSERFHMEPTPDPKPLPPIEVLQSERFDMEPTPVILWRIRK